MGTVTVFSGSSSSSTVTVTVPPSATVYETSPQLTATDVGASSSSIETTVSSSAPAVTRSGRVPKVSFTLSPSSSTESSVAEKVKLFEVSPLSKVTELGTPL